MDWYDILWEKLSSAMTRSIRENGDLLILPPVKRFLRDDDVRILREMMYEFRDEFQGSRVSVNFDRLLDLLPREAKSFAFALQDLETVQHVSIVLSAEDDSDFGDEDEVSGDDGSEDQDDDSVTDSDDGYDVDSGQDDDSSDEDSSDNYGFIIGGRYFVPFGYGNSEEDVNPEDYVKSILEGFLGGLATHEELSSLELRSAPVGAFLANFLRATTPRLKKLSFVNCTAAIDDCSALFQAMGKVQIEELRVCGGFRNDTFFSNILKAAIPVNTMRALEIKEVMWDQDLAIDLRNCISGSHLTKLALQGSGKLTEVLAQGLQAASIETLHLSGISFSEHGVSAFRSYLCNDNSLGELQLANMELGLHDLQELSAGLRSNKSLRVLSLESCLWSDCLFGHLSGTIGEILRDHNQLKTLALECNNLSNEVLHGIASGLRENRALSSLSLRGNRISDVTEIVRALGQNSSLSSLDLRENMISGSATWSEGLADRPTPLEVNLLHCPLQNDALVDLSMALSRQGLLSKLQIGYVPGDSPQHLFTGDGIIPLIRSVQSNVYLKDLELFPDTWENVAFDSLLEALPQCVALRSLHTCRLWQHSNGVREHRLSVALKQNKSLFQVKVDGLSFDMAQFYLLRNRVDYALGAYSTVTRPVLLERVLEWPQRNVGFSVVMHIFKTCPTFLDSMRRRGITRPSSSIAP